MTPSMPPGGAEIALALPAGVRLPPGHRLLTLAERPDLGRPADLHDTAAWPEFMLHDAVANALWPHLRTTFAPFQVCLVDSEDAIAATLNAAPLRWDGTDEGLPAGWDEQFEHSVADAGARREPDTRGALQVVVAPSRRGEGLARLMIEVMRTMARESGYRALIACVRPTLKERYPLIPIERYARWMLPDGSPFDPWIRLHVHIGGRIARAVAASMRIEGAIDEWRSWTGLAFPETGEYVVPGAAAPVSVDLAADRALYLDPNVWVVHGLAQD